MTSRPTREAPMIPTLTSRSSRTGLNSSILSFQLFDWISQGMRLSITTIIATVVSATGVALPAAAVVIWMPRSYIASVAMPLTDPAL
jgi:hypothetical protein